MARAAFTGSCRCHRSHFRFVVSGLYPLASGTNPLSTAFFIVFCFMSTDPLLFPFHSMRNTLTVLLLSALLSCGELGLRDVHTGDYTCSYYPAEIAESESRQLVAYLYRSDFPAKNTRLGKTDGNYEVAFEGNPDAIDSTKRKRILSAMARELSDSCFAAAPVIVLTSNCLDCTKYNHYRGYSWK